MNENDREITISVHKNIKEYFYEMYEARKDTLKFSETIVDKLINEDEETKFTLEEVKNIKDSFNMKSIALFYSRIKPPPDITPNNFRNTEGNKLEKWDYKVIDWVQNKRAMYYECLEALNKNIPKFTLRDECQQYKKDIPKLASFVRGKIEELDNSLAFGENIEQDKKDKKDVCIRNLIFALEELNILVFSQPYSRGVDGFVIQGEDELPIIFFNTIFGHTRARFTIAHELGHLLLHEDKISTPDKKIKFDDGNSEEKEANQFAIHFLLPVDVLQKELGKLIEKKQIKNYLEYLSEIFVVSKEAVYYHIKNHLIDTLDKEVQDKIEKEKKNMDDKKEKGGSGGGRNASYEYKSVIQHGINSSYQFFLARDEDKISPRDFYNYFQLSNLSISLDLDSIRKNFLYGEII